MKKVLFTPKGFFVRKVDENVNDKVIFIKFKDIYKIYSTKVNYSGELYIYVEDVAERVLCRIDTLNIETQDRDFERLFSALMKYHKKDNDLKQIVERLDKFIETVEFAPGNAEYNKAKEEFQDSLKKL